MIGEVLGAHIVQDHVHAIDRDSPHRGGPVVAVGDRMVCPDRATVVELVFATRSRDDRRPEGLGVLNGERADATCAAVHQKQVTVSKADELDV